MELRGKFKVLEIKKKTNAVFFKELKVNDEFELRYDFNGSYQGAPSVDIYKDGKFVHMNNAVQLSSNLDKFKIVQI